VVHDGAFRCRRDRRIEVKNGGSVKLTMSVDARSKDYVCVCVCVWMLNAVVV
jgi:hypothetical protein